MREYGWNFGGAENSSVVHLTGAIKSSVIHVVTADSAVLARVARARFSDVTVGPGEVFRTLANIVRSAVTVLRARGTVLAGVSETREEGITAVSHPSGVRLTLAGVVCEIWASILANATVEARI